MQGARREHSLSYATDDQRSLMEKATAQTSKLFMTRSIKTDTKQRVISQKFLPLIIRFKGK